MDIFIGWLLEIFARKRQLVLFALVTVFGAFPLVALWLWQVGLL